jgi:hypothetical protein
MIETFLLLDFGIMTGFELKDNKKFFWMRWLIPKPGHLSKQRLKDAPLTMDDFVESKNMIKIWTHAS